MCRVVYFFYYLRETDYGKLRKFLKYAVRKTGRSSVSILLDTIRSSFKHNISLLDYFYFRFFELDESCREEWVGTGFIYEYQKRMNPKSSRKTLENKIRFLNRFKHFIKREFFTLQEIEDNHNMAIRILSNPSGKVVLKGSTGQAGREVQVISSKDLSTVKLISLMKRRHFDLLEEYVVQHHMLMKLSSSGLNTVRIITQLHNGIVEILGARLRISVNSTVDNMAAGNLAADVDIETGLVIGPGVYSDITIENVSIHPISGQPIIGFSIPYWKNVIELVTNAALQVPDNLSIGWDVALTETGPELIEGNHNWCKLLWQLPVKRGLKKELVRYL